VISGEGVTVAKHPHSFWPYINGDLFHANPEKFLIQGSGFNEKWGLVENTELWRVDKKSFEPAVSYGAIPGIVHFGQPALLGNAGLMWVDTLDLGTLLMYVDAEEPNSLRLVKEPSPALMLPIY